MYVRPFSVIVPFCRVRALPQPALGRASPVPPLNVAVTDRAAVMVTTQLPVPVHAPPQRPNVEPVAAAADSVTAVPLGYAALHAASRVMPAGLEVTVPFPVPAFCAVSA